eukprot:GILJ01003457.1.p1 GENE.GILJ01003457.1~~GILJ01003457.1.p1  ORF type:complete len:199 (+),score=11.18 GILJ01003457.1:296-892(+)
MPPFLSAALSRESFSLEQSMWTNRTTGSARTVYSSPFLADKFTVDIRTELGDDLGTNGQIFGPKLQDRDVEFLDIAKPVDKRSYRFIEDPTKFHSRKGVISPLRPGWWRRPGDRLQACCVYKLVRVKLNQWPITDPAERFILNFVRDGILRIHRAVYCTSNDWIQERQNIADCTGEQEETIVSSPAARATRNPLRSRL